MKIKQYILFILIALISFSCKKNESPTSPKPTISITNLQNGIAIFEQVYVKMEVYSPTEVSFIRLYIDQHTDSTLITRNKPFTIIWNVNDVIDSTVHQLYAEAELANGESIRSSAIQVISYKFTPRNLHIDSFTETSLSLSWQGNTKQGMKYFIEQAIGDSSFVIKDSTANILSKVISGVYKTNQTYRFRIRAQKDSLWSNYSTVVQEIIPFVAPTLQHAFSTNDSTIVIELQSNSTIEKSFQIESSTDGIAFNIVKNISADSVSTNIISNYVIGTRYYYRVCAKSIHNTSPYSNILGTTILFVPPAYISLTSFSNNQFQIKWENRSRYTKSFAIERRIDNQDFSKIATVDNSTTAYIENQADKNHLYQYRIQAICGTYVSNYSDSATVRFGQYDTCNFVNSLHGHSKSVRSMAFAAQDSILVSGSEDYTVKFWDTNSLNLIRTINTGATSLAYGPHVCGFNQYVAVIMADTAIDVFEATTGTLVKHLSPIFPGLIYSIDFSSDGQFLIANANTLHMWRVSDWSLIYTTNQGSPQYKVKFSPDNKYFATGNNLGRAYVYKTESGQLLYTLNSSYSTAVWSVCFSPNSQELATGSNVGLIEFWNLKDGGKKTGSISNPNGSVLWDIVYTNYGEIISASDDAIIRLWRDNTLIGSIAGGNLPFQSLALSNDNQKLFVGTKSGSIGIMSISLKWAAIK